LQASTALFHHLRSQSKRFLPHPVTPLVDRSSSYPLDSTKGAELVETRQKRSKMVSPMSSLELRSHSEMKESSWWLQESWIWVSVNYTNRKQWSKWWRTMAVHRLKTSSFLTHPANLGNGHRPC
jgi:hypothetical protein